jgi:hypothetical protein
MQANVQSKKKGKKETHVATSTSTKIDDFAKKFEKEFSLVACLSGSGSATFGDIGAWFVDSGSSRHMTGMRSMFLRCFRDRLRLSCGLWD